MRYSGSSNHFNTNFIYKFSNIKNKEAQIQFEKISNEIFECNLTLIDSFLPKIMAELVLHSYLNNINSITELTQILEKENPLGYNYTNSQHFYEYKIKRFLQELANGMLPNKVWDGENSFNSGNTFGQTTDLFHNAMVEITNTSDNETFYIEEGELVLRVGVG